MIIATKIKLKPTKEQEVLFWKSAGVARWAYNHFLSESERYYNENSKSIKESDVRKNINNVLKKTTHTWLKEVGSNVMKQGVKDASLARDRWFKGLSGKPKFKSRRKSKISFYVNYESLKKVKGGFRGEKIGFVKTYSPLPKLKEEEKYSNPRISFDGKSWFLSVGYNVDFKPVQLTGKSLGIDVGIKSLAVCSDGELKKNINKTKRVNILKKKLKREQRKVSRKLEANTIAYTKNRKPIYKTPLKDMKNIQKQNKIIRNLYKKLTDIRTNHLHQTTSAIVKTKPSRIVMETLNIKNMMKNKHLSKAIAEQCLYEFKRQIQYKCKKYGIEFVAADKWYPSSKKCSCCGAIKKDLKLKDRIYKCSCGFKLDRDLNASINLANYSI
ncbi:IS200/IS605 family element transposase accessory protein TnpB [Clostridium botulinum]|uniref:RNA-guided endonuclease InsQ/TnpB family protein n=1 Tax=Clostridium botulinum TaxID=1491 RepID=UPI00035F5090|nr:RNA-guided endonuclease TnpB family protein [Clostridium botulinum]MBN1036194.1 transposase [Clostridium botulinum]MBY6836868.1 IS200/IS605 family element transposase accessory protein TnpB [Clostridium botulinum]NFG64075.1 IS200/IS605 family element transposase accessory protein TnpB [Clostridium botulinum]NFL34991.1 IS200/IS605 family element transposase accessory protein TnpB [Clostridium botulinum]NFM04570.1 IS200/IS605 family element transposase accessory protein TnpB [Clostridium botu